MAYAPSRGKNSSLLHGTTEGKYFYRRPNTEDPDGRNSSATNADRQALNMWDGYNQKEVATTDSPGR